MEKLFKFPLTYGQGCFWWFRIDFENPEIVKRLRDIAPEFGNEFCCQVEKDDRGNYVLGLVRTFKKVRNCGLMKKFTQIRGISMHDVQVGKLSR